MALYLFNVFIYLMHLSLHCYTLKYESIYKLKKNKNCWKNSNKIKSYFPG